MIRGQTFHHDSSTSHVRFWHALLFTHYPFPLEHSPSMCPVHWHFQEQSEVCLILHIHYATWRFFICCAFCQLSTLLVISIVIIIITIIISMIVVIIIIIIIFNPKYTWAIWVEWRHISIESSYHHHITKPFPCFLQLHFAFAYFVLAPIYKLQLQQKYVRIYK